MITDKELKEIKTLQAWVRWALKNPINEDQRAHALATQKLIEEVKQWKQRYLGAMEVLKDYHVAQRVLDELDPYKRKIVNDRR